MRSGRANTAPRAFTIVEVIVVVIILAILAAAVATRLGSLGGREVRASALAVGDLVSVAARRDALTSQRVALEFDAAKGFVSLMVLATPPPDTIGAAEWREDKLASHVSLGDAKLSSALVDGVPLDSKGWRVEFPQGNRRPALELVVSDAGNKEHWRIELPSGASHAVVSAGGAGGGMADQSIDLDATGGGTAPW